MVRKILYSCNYHVKYQIHRDYRGGKHWIWCSQFFDARQYHHLGSVAGIPPSSNPATVLSQMMREAHPVLERRGHSLKIEQQRLSMTKRAGEWYRSGEITGDQYAEIVGLLTQHDSDMWRPALYIVPLTDALTVDRLGLGPRLVRPPRAEWAGTGPEFQIRDLDTSEFDMILLDYAAFP